MVSISGHLKDASGIIAENYQPGQLFQENKTTSDFGEEESLTKQQNEKLHKKLDTMTNKLIVRVEVTFSWLKGFNLDGAEEKKIRKEFDKAISINGEVYNVIMTEFGPTREVKRVEIEIRITSENVSWLNHINYS